MKPDDIPEDVWRDAEEAFDLMLCNCIEASGTTEQLRVDSITPLAMAIMSERRHGMEMAEKAFSKMDEEAYGAIVKLKAALATIRDKTREPSISAFASLILSEV